MRKFKSWLAVLGLLVAFFVVAPSQAQAAPYCGITWGSLAKSAGKLSSAPITSVRAGRHACFDRLVVDINGHGGGHMVRYVATVHREGSGTAVLLRGGAFLQVTVKDPAYIVATGAQAYRPANPNELVNTAGYSALRQVALAGSFESQTTLGVGVRARLPFTVFVLNGPGNQTRLVIDVAHRW
ncbi:hypothetical protein CVV68_20505 [Arthrobacter livingstonensis]|uniref:AMIN-like domain-containing protein n=1 Tax=Arthrobacter livingstonensis TaxID=670078 RepID=A0A2V5L417_9MICC|nr:hypothetical protein [Arthrobacter livingstonensis]PYI64874.1 hypothetical protein CVV68_20505 [Arthrobacter livingstonensis]